LKGKEKDIASTPGRLERKKKAEVANVNVQGSHIKRLKKKGGGKPTKALYNKGKILSGTKKGKRMGVDRHRTKVMFKKERGHKRGKKKEGGKKGSISCLRNGRKMVKWESKPHVKKGVESLWRWGFSLSENYAEQSRKENEDSSSKRGRNGERKSKGEIRIEDTAVCITGTKLEKKKG